MDFKRLVKMLHECEARERNAEKKGKNVFAKKKKKRKIANESRKRNR